MRKAYEIAGLLLFTACAIEGLRSSCQGDWARASTFYILCALVMRLL